MSEQDTIQELKRQLQISEEKAEKYKNIAETHQQVIDVIREDLAFFFDQWFDCVEMWKQTGIKSFRSRAHAARLWFEHCLDVFPENQDDLMSLIFKDSQMSEKQSEDE